MYHYTTLNAMESIITGKKIWLSSAADMEDTSDRSFGSECVKNMLCYSNCEPFVSMRKHLSENEIEEAFSVDNMPFYTMSFCEADNECLWKNYAGKSTGVRIEFDEIRIKNTLNTIIKASEGYSVVFQPLNFFDVVYGSGEEKILTTALNVGEYYKNEKTDYKNWLKAIVMIVSGTIKTETYHNEKERRIIFKDRFCSDYLSNTDIFTASFNAQQQFSYNNTLEYLGLNNLKKDTDKKHYEMNFEKFIQNGCITGITIGKNASTSIEDVKDLLMKNGIKNVDVNWQIKLS